MNGLAVADIAPTILPLVPTRVQNKRTVGQAMVDSTWEMDINGEPPFMALIQLMHLRVATMDAYHDPQATDTFTWPWDASGQYTARSVYRALHLGLAISPTYECIWRSGAILKCKIFAWLAVQYRLWTSDRRARHGLQDSTTACYTCLQEEDTVDHILLHCPYAREVWHLCFTQISVTVRQPQPGDSLEAWWLQVRSAIVTRDRRGFDTIVIFVAWSLWKQRNAGVFGRLEQQRRPRQLVHQIFDELREWDEAGVGRIHRLVSS